MAVWNSQYKLNPPDDNNPGYGAASIRDLKSNLEGIIGADHYFDLTETSTEGQHKQGTAIIEYETEDSDVVVVDNAQVGRLRGDLLEEGEDYLEIDHDVVNLQVMSDDGYLNVKGYDQASTLMDENINGEWTFIQAPLLTATIDYNDEDLNTDTIANVEFVVSQSSTTGIEPTIVNVGPSVDVDLYTYGDKDNILASIDKELTDSENLEELLAQVQSQLTKIRSALIAVAAMSPYDQDLTESADVTFGTIEADIVSGAVWG